MRTTPNNLSITIAESPRHADREHGNNMADITNNNLGDEQLTPISTAPGECRVASSPTSTLKPGRRTANFSISSLLAVETKDSPLVPVTSAIDIATGSSANETHSSAVHPARQFSGCWYPWLPIGGVASTSGLEGLSSE